MEHQKLWIRWRRITGYASCARGRSTWPIRPGPKPAKPTWAARKASALGTPRASEAPRPGRSCKRARESLAAALRLLLPPFFSSFFFFLYLFHLNKYWLIHAINKHCIFHPKQFRNSSKRFHTYPETTLASICVKCVTLRVRECVDMISINNQ
jgi:hypothetical protein